MSLRWLIVLCIMHSFVLPFTLMIDPAGDAGHPGRSIDGTFERGLTLQCAQKIKSKLETQINPIHVIITRVAGEQISDLHNIQFANRIMPDLYISLHFFQETAVIPRVALYLHTHDGKKRSSPERLALHTIDTIHMLYSDASSHYARMIHTLFTSDQNLKKFSCASPIVLPYTPLIGISAPALAIEVGLRHKNDFESLIEQLCAAITHTAYNTI